MLQNLNLRIRKIICDSNEERLKQRPSKSADTEKVASMQALLADNFWGNCGYFWIINIFLVVHTKYVHNSLFQSTITLFLLESIPWIEENYSFFTISFSFREIQLILRTKWPWILILLILLVQRCVLWTKCIIKSKPKGHLMLKMVWNCHKRTSIGEKLSFSSIFHDFLAISWYLMPRI